MRGIGPSNIPGEQPTGGQSHDWPCGTSSSPGLFLQQTGVNITVLILTIINRIDLLIIK